ncbi:hypothetical protein LDL08_27295 [Nonomuraea glycinis]|uniref:hypothetical protein n=1 Tax=Nonomuraea glycinis TaxID=2047744 RepID=UPI00166F2931|nr:hypothetical protein [Nonomuraea glycinis]MCA2179890.1 hypothetical protein [Nonomuraea glycinis]
MLLVGPHPQALVDEVVARASAAAVLLRSYPDACALGERHPGLAVHCGRLEAFTGDEPYDLVLALDGLGRTHSAEAPAAAWRESLAALAALVAPGGRLVLGVRNDLGVDRFVEARPPDRDGGDDQWEPHGFDPTYPDGPAALDAALESAGLEVGRCYSAYPDSRAPRALLSREALAHDLPEALAFALSARAEDRMLVADPLRLTRLVFRHRLGEELAPLWLAVATRPPASSEPMNLPLGLIEEGQAVHEVTSAQAAHETAVHEVPAQAAHESAVHGVPAQVAHEIPQARAVHRGSAGTGQVGVRRLPSGEVRPIPAGRVVEEILVEACAREDVRAVRKLLGALAGWVEEGGDAAAATDSLVWDGERFAAIGAGPAPQSSPAPDVVLCRILWRFAVRLLAAGHHHPWPWPLQADQLTLTLCGMAGRSYDQDELDLARKLDAELGGPGEQAVPAYRDLLRTRDRLTDQLTMALARIGRLEIKLTYRERELVRARAKLRRTQRKASAYRRTLGYRLSRRLSRPRQVARRVMRLLSG